MVLTARVVAGHTRLLGYILSSPCITSSLTSFFMLLGLTISFSIKHNLYLGFRHKTLQSDITLKIPRVKAKLVIQCYSIVKN